MRPQREAIAAQYFERVRATSTKSSCPPVARTAIHSWHLFPIRLRLERLTIDRNAFIDALKAAGVGCSVHWRPLHLHPYYEETVRLEAGALPGRDARVGTAREPAAVSDDARDGDRARGRDGQEPVPQKSRDGAGRPGEALTARRDAVGSARPGLPRAFEFLLALAGLVIAAPVIALAAIGTILTSGFPVFFRQARMGRGGRPFTLIKLRSMKSSRGGPQVTARGDARVTPFGRFLRRSKLDELPELWNVLKGEMSFVGPRPEVPGLVDPANPLWSEVLEARPGLTDPVTVRLRDEEALLAGIDGGDREAFYRDSLQPFKLRGYCEYLRRRTWQSDVGVLWETVLAILWPSRSRSEGGATRPPGPPGAQNP